MTSLEEALATVDQWYLVRDGFEVWVREVGTGNPVVVVHGGFGIEHSELVAPMMPLTEDHRVLWYDQRGSIRSPGTAEQQESITFDAHVDDLLALIDEVGGRADVVAHSMGTVLVMAALARRPECFGRVVLVGAIPPTDGDQFGRAEDWMTRRGQQAEAVIGSLGLDRPGLTAREDHLAWRIRFAFANSVRDDAWLTIRWPGRAWYREEVADRSGRGMPGPEVLLDAVASHGADVVLGDTDYVDMGGREWQRIAAAHEGIRLHVIEDCGHSPWYDRPDEFARLLPRLFRD